MPPEDPQPEQSEPQQPVAESATDATDWKAEAEKWKAMSRRHEGQAKENVAAAKRLAEIEEASKTEAQKLADQAKAAEDRAVAAEAKAMRAVVAHRKGLTEAQAKRLIGSTEEELDADADELLASFRTGEGEKDTRPARPKEQLKSGATGADQSGLPQLTGDDLRDMSPEAIVKARAAGQFDVLLGTK